jgi:hypothetical protein
MADARLDYSLGSALPRWSVEEQRAAMRFHADKQPGDSRAWVDLSPDEQGVYRETQGKTTT